MSARARLEFVLRCRKLARATRRARAMELVEPGALSERTLVMRDGRFEGAV
jgi:hypothetical protein